MPWAGSCPRSPTTELPAPFPDAGHRTSQLLIRDVEVPLRLLDVRVPEHQLDVRMSTPSASSRHAPSCRRSCQCKSISRSGSRLTRPPWLGACTVTFVGAQEKRFPRGLERVVVFALGSAEDVCGRTERGPASEDRRQATMGVEGNAPVVAVLGVRTRDDELMPFPIHVAVLNPKHLSFPATRLECTDDAIVHRCPHPAVRASREFQGGLQQALFLIGSEAPSRFTSSLTRMTTPNR